MLSAKELKNQCRNKIYRKNNRNVCKEALDKCKNRMFRSVNPGKCEKVAGDNAWLKEKCETQVFSQKNFQICESIKDSNNTVVEKSNNLNDDAEFESLEELLQKCSNGAYQVGHADKCKVVETIEFEVDEFNNSEKTKPLNIIDVKVKDGTITENEKAKPDVLSGITKQESIESEIAETRLKKNKCNKPKYAAKNPTECGKKDLDNVLEKKCKKRKYSEKHKERCKDFESFRQRETETNKPIDEFVLTDVRCQKKAFKRNYPELCQSEVREEDPDWLEEQCRHESFFFKHEDICKELCKKNNKNNKMIQKVCDIISSDDDQDEISNESTENLIANVINDIKNIVSEENKSAKIVTTIPTGLESEETSMTLKTTEETTPQTTPRSSSNT